MSGGFDEARFRAELARAGGDARRDVHVHAEIDSTSSELLRRLAADPRPGTVVVAGVQRAGRGRQGRAWHSPGGNLHLSVATAVAEPLSELLPLVPLAAGVAAEEALRAAAPAAPLALKWPNDVLADGRKVAGILCELPRPSARPALIAVGIGVNLAVHSFPAKLAAMATSLGRFASESIAPEPVAARFVVRLEHWIAALGHGGRSEILAAWRARAEPFGRSVRVGEVVGTTVGLDDAGRLIVREAGGREVAIAGGIVEPL